MGLDVSRNYGLDVVGLAIESFAFSDPMPLAGRTTQVGHPDRAVVAADLHLGPFRRLLGLSYEVSIGLGKYKSAEEKIERTLYEWNASIRYYEELIENASKQYQEFLDKSGEVRTLNALLESLSPDGGTD